MPPKARVFPQQEQPGQGGHLYIRELKMPNTRKTGDDYRAQGRRIGIMWTGAVLPRRVTESTRWYCSVHNTFFSATYAKVKTWRACPICNPELLPWKICQQERTGSEN